MSIFFILSLVLSFNVSLSLAQGSINLKLLEKIPSIDGKPDVDLTWHDFPVIEKSSSNNSLPGARYMIGYDVEYLYMIIEYDSNSITTRDRAYQNGDGFHLVISKVESDQQRTKEFYVLRFSPPDIVTNQPALKALWYYNVNLSGKQLSRNTKFSCDTSNGKCYMELLMPWQEVYPYHPLFTEDIGFNLCFVKAIGNSERNFYFLKEDPYIQWELRDRDYLKVAFEGLENYNCSQFTQARISRLNFKETDTLVLDIKANVEKDAIVNFAYNIRSADMYSYNSSMRSMNFKPGLNNQTIAIAIDNLKPGGYLMTWRCTGGFEGEIPFTLLPHIDYKEELDKLAKMKSSVLAGDYNSLHFMLKNITNNLTSLKSYETAGTIRENFIKYKETVDALITKGYARKQGIYRRAFISAVDSSLQPYTIKIPANYDNLKKYPLLVMLHGSGSDDQGMLNNTLTDGEFIEIAPFGRGTSNCFSADYAEIDVKEAIQDVIKNYSIDKEKIILAGFSMGGYGAYRIFYEYPELFKGVSVFSGHPNLANKWLGGGHPDFLQDKNLKYFKNVPIFIYHSKNDLNCPYELTDQLIHKLEKAGAKVEIVTTDNSGHGIIDSDEISVYHNWLRSIVE